MLNILNPRKTKQIQFNAPKPPENRPVVFAAENGSGASGASQLTKPVVSFI